MLLALIPNALAAPAIDLDVGASTEVPVWAGIHGQAKLPFGLRGGLGIGMMPGPYLDMINDIGTGVGWYDDATAQVIDAALQQSTIISADVGYAIVGGLFVDAGVNLGLLGGNSSAIELLAAAQGVEVPEALEDDARDFDLNASLTMAKIEFGYRLSAKKIVVTPSIGGAFTVSSKATLEPNFTTRGPAAEAAVDSFSAEGEAWLESEIKRVVHTPTVGLTIAWKVL